MNKLYKCKASFHLLFKKFDCLTIKPMNKAKIHEPRELRSDLIYLSL